MQVVHGAGGRGAVTHDPRPLLRCSAVKKLLVLVAVLGLAFLAAKKLRST